MKYFLGLAILFVLGGCTTTDKNLKQDDQVDPYLRTLEKSTAGDEDYNGFYNQFSFRATLLNSDVREAILQKQADYYQWDKPKLTSEKQKADQEMASQTAVFVSFFTPDRKNDNLVDAKSIWRVYLDAGGRRFVASVQKSKKLLAELATLYPYHARWNTPYVFTFPVPTSSIEREKTVLTITGPLGTRNVEFSALVGTPAPPPQ